MADRIINSGFIGVSCRKEPMAMKTKEILNSDTLWNIKYYWKVALDDYGTPLVHNCISILYGIYRNLTLFNMSIFLLKYIPTGIYMYRLIKNIYVTSRVRIKEKELELEDIQLQIQIVNTKMYVRESEFSERAEQLRRSAERLRALRARVRDMIAADENLTRALGRATPWGDEPQLQTNSTPEEERDFIITLLKELKTDNVTFPEEPLDKMDCGEHANEARGGEESVYSSLSDGEKDCRVKIVKVTNVYKVAYLKHYIKQKRLRRAANQAMLRKKIESIKKLLEDWQKSLNMVINTNISMLNTNPLDLASQEAMGDYSKPNLCDSSDSDSDLRNNVPDAYCDEFNQNWAQNNYRCHQYNFEDIPEINAVKDMYNPPEIDNKYQNHQVHYCECSHKNNFLFSLPEETTSQLAIEEMKGNDCDKE